LQTGADPQRALDVKPKAVVFTAAVCFALFAFAFVIAPAACEGGLSTYVWSGLAAVGTLFAVPFVSLPQLPLGSRVLRGLVLALLASAVWAAGLFAADMRIVCRLF
jgi:hypothetical protein